MTAKTVLIILATSLVDEKGVLRFAGDKIEVTQEFLDKQNEICDKADLPKHVVVEQPKADGGKVDGGKVDGGKVDGGKVDGGKVDGGKADGGKVDGGKATKQDDL